MFLGAEEVFGDVCFLCTADLFTFTSLFRPRVDFAGALRASKIVRLADEGSPCWVVTVITVDTVAVVAGIIRNMASQLSAESAILELYYSL